jgi:bla regulator protein BlaR1
MIPVSLSPVANHLWQSTLFAGAAGLLTLALRKNPARARHWIWVAASWKFLIPFSLFVAMGGQIEWKTSPARVPAAPMVSVVMQQFTQPFPVSAVPAPVQPAANPLPRILFGIWACGFIGMSISWWVRWRRIGNSVRAASPVELGLPFAAVSSPSFGEPGIFGIFRPVLMLPEGVFEHLTPAQLKAVVAHELCHVRHRDNAIGTAQMLVETLFWFHPLVWWIGQRIFHERERACDEEVLLLGSEPRTYAQAILTVCELYLDSQLPCVAGISGADLKGRVREILSNRIRRELTPSKRMLIAAAGVLSVVGPVIVGAMNTPFIRAQSPRTAASPTLPPGPPAVPAQPGPVVAPLRIARAQAAPTPSTPAPPPAVVLPQFEVASIKAGDPDSRLLRPLITPGGNLRAGNVTLRTLIEDAYGIKPFQITGGSRWIYEDKFQVLAKGEESATPDQVRLMLQALLAERFQLVVRRETREQTIAWLTVQDQSRLSPSGYGTTFEFMTAVPPGHAHIEDRVRSASWVNHVSFKGTSMAKLADMIARQLGYMVEDRTGLGGAFDFQLDATHGENDPNMFNAPWAPSLGQIGLNLESGRGPVEFLLIESAQRPPEN